MADQNRPGATWGGTDVTTGKKFAFNAGYFYNRPVPVLPESPAMSKPKLSRAFAKLADDPFADFGDNVHGSMNLNAAFTTPIILMVDLLAHVAALRSAIVAVPTGGHPAAIAKIAARELLLSDLRALASYIEQLPGMTDVIAVTSGFNLIKPRTNIPKLPERPAILTVFNVASTKLGVTITGGANTIYFEFRATVDGKTYTLVGTSPSKRDIVLENLIPGTNYTIECRACGGHKLFSEWSDPVSHMCT